MKSVHVSAYMLRDLRGSYAKTKTDEGIGYAMFRTKTLAQENIKWYFPDGGFVVKVRAAITPVDSGRTERMVAVQKARPKAVPEAQQELRF